MDPFVGHLDSVICGDNVEVMATWPNACIDLVVTSPPYDDLRSYLFANAVILRDNLTHEQKAEIIAELHQSGIKPRQSS